MAGRLHQNTFLGDLPNVLDRFVGIKMDTTRADSLVCMGSLNLVCSSRRVTQGQRGFARIQSFEINSDRQRTSYRCFLEDHGHSLRRIFQKALGTWASIPEWNIGRAIDPIALDPNLACFCAVVFWCYVHGKCYCLPLLEDDPYPAAFDALCSIALDGS